MAAGEAEPTPPWLVEHLCETPTLAFAGGWEAFATTGDVWAAAPSLDMPTLLLVGLGPDEPEWWAQAQRFADVLPHAEAVALEGAQHLAAFHRTDLTLPPIRDFLERVTPER
jgi:pimeloyl-ACP methyl ester carboxylesterase